MARMRAGGAVEVHGLAELSRALKTYDKELAKELRSAGKEAATTVADRARARAQGLGSVAAHASPSVKPSVGANYAGVALGDSAHPEAAGAEFGSVRFAQFQPWTGNGPDAGYFLYPTIRDDDKAWLEPYEDAVDRVAKKAGLL